MNTSSIYQKADKGRYWITDKYIYVMLLIFPLFLGFSGYSRLTLSKYIFFVAATALWLMVLLVQSIIAGRSGKTPQFLAVTTLLGLFFLLCCISAVLSPYGVQVLIGSGRYDGLLTWLLCGGIFFGIYRFALPKTAYVYALAASATLCCVVALFQLFGFNMLWFFPGNCTYYDGGIKYMGEFLGTIGNADLFSAFLCLVIPLLWATYIIEKKRPLGFLPCIMLMCFCVFACGVSAGKLALAVVAVIMSPLLITDGSRLRRGLELAALLCVALFFVFGFNGEKQGETVFIIFTLGKKALIMGLFFLILVALRLLIGKREFEKKPLRTVFICLSLLAVFCALTLAYFWEGQSGTLYEFSRVLHGDFQDSFGSSRILIWRNLLGLVPERLPFGGGPDSLALRLDVSFSRFVPETGNTLSCVVDNAHNEYLGILVNTGLLSLLAFVFAQASSFWCAIKRQSSGQYIMPLLCGLVCYWIQAFFGLGLFIVTPFMWIFWGLLSSSVSRHPAEQSSVPSEHP